MKGISLFFSFSLFVIVSCIREEAESASQAKNDDIYIVYMGAAASSNGGTRNDQMQLVSSLIKRNKNTVVHSYKNGFSGFAARLSEAEAQSIAQRPGVVSVFPDPVLQLHTTRSWDFLKYQTVDETNSSPSSGSDSSPNGADTIIGILDTGIWPESKSFNDKGMGPIPARWKGTCMDGHDFGASKCNKKIVGARFYEEFDGRGTKMAGSARDENGHGTHVASTAAGSPVAGASYYGLAAGTAKGGSPGSRIAVYRVCTSNGCRGSAIMKAFDDAIADGVDVLSLSLGSSPGFEELSKNPIAIGAFHAVEKGIVVVCSAGNSGPDPKTVVNTAPWILTVAATTIDRDFETDIILGGNKLVKGGGINFGNMTKSAVYPLIQGYSAKLNKRITEEEARGCVPDSLDKNKVKGKIVVCENLQNDGFSPSDRLLEVKSRGGVGFILIDDDLRTVAPKFESFPAAAVSRKDGTEIISYIKSTRKSKFLKSPTLDNGKPNRHANPTKRPRNPVASILPTVSTTKYKPAPVVPYFSSRGPAGNTPNLLKPDITAPGVTILAAWPGNKQPMFNILSGTSMSCPHVSGIAATVKAQNPTWGPSTIKSAIMTTAIQTNNLKAPITTNFGSKATPYDIGAGEASTSGPLKPGLVYATDVADYLHFLCSVGYDISKIKLISSTVPKDFSCPKHSSSELVSNMNYPSIAISGLKKYKTKKVTRTVTNVGEEASVYIAIVEAPTGLRVQVIPSKLEFTNKNKKLSYEVSFRASSTTKEDMFGSITWTNGKYKVRSPFVVSNSG
ncbi:CO(2)-response secreted protease-like isoform X1 [Nicotiana sylvestris]|uniref:CO(2)-response secreted protease isoform X1 n=2 Tax=Nicotiana TaxID=4085 RepID=A0A1S4BJA8_TOBAC|nr:PREDICTED: subtilisin-like protease isoform X1 [Nicotiana sylvestris]XP_016488941.1 PREDICTED: CO(2)-response secreted protease-like isoform X1 [Nicotiana tabacum]